MTAERQRRLKEAHRICRHLIKTFAPDQIVEAAKSVIRFMDGSDWREKRKWPKLNHLRD